MRNSASSFFLSHIFFTVFALMFVSSHSVGADNAVVERHALVIGNSDYISQPLRNPRYDAIDMARQLQELGYKVHNGGPLLDVDRLGIERAVRAFAQQLPKNANALFYYAGHGMAVEKDNYLLPMNHNLESEDQLPDRAVSLRSVIKVLKNANREGLNVFLLDACRDNPLENTYRSTSAGMTRLEDIPRGVFVGYAADAGQVAEDGKGRNGTYTAELLNVMRERPDVIIELAHKDVSARVFEKTRGKQFPVSENKVYGDWCFGNCGSTAFTTAPDINQASVSPALPAVQPEEQETAFNSRWLIAGAAILLLGVLSQSGGGSEPSNTNFTLEVLPPELGD